MKCQWYEFRINWHDDDDRPLPAKVRAHIKSCSRCNTFYRVQTRLRHHLTSATDHPVSPTVFLKSRILNEIAGESSIPARLIRRRWSVTGGFVAVVIAATAGMVAFNPDPRPPEFDGMRLAPEWIDLTDRVTSGENLFRVTTNLNQPLQREMDLVIQSAQAALNSLANDFVPAGLLAAKN